MLQEIWTLTHFDLRNPKAPKNVQSTLRQFKFFQDGMYTIAEDVRLQKLRTARRMEQQSRCSSTDEVAQYLGERVAKVNIAFTILRF